MTKKITQLIRMLPAALLLLCAAGCTSEEVRTSGGESGTEGGDMVTMSFRLTAPDPAAAATRATRAQSAEETKVTTADVLVFTQSGGSYTFAYHAGTTELSPDGSSFKARLTRTANPVKLYVLANALRKFTVPAAGTSEAAVRAALTMNVRTDTLSSRMPMWGELSLPNITADGTQTAPAAISLTRAVAKATITVEDAYKPHFKMSKVYLVRTRSRIALIPGADADTPNTPPNATAQILGEVEFPVQNQSECTLYMTEDPGFATAAQVATGIGSAGHTCIIVQASVDGAPERFYRMDPIHRDTQAPYTEHHARIVRNHHYRFSIRGALSGAETTLQAAMARTTASLVYHAGTTSFDMGAGLTVIQFDDIDRLSAGQKQIILAPEAGTRDIPVHGGNTPAQQLRIAAVSANPVFAQSINLPGIGTVEVQIQNGSPVLHFNSIENTTGGDNTAHLLLQAPGRILILDVIKKSPQTIGITAQVQGASNPQRAEFLSQAGISKTINVASTTDWQVQGVPAWLSARKINETQLLITTTSITQGSDREAVMRIENQMGQHQDITVYQQYRLEWAAGYSRGGEHIVDPQILHNNAAGTGRRFYYPTTSQNSTLGFAQAVADTVTYFKFRRIPLATAPNDPKDEPVNPLMAGDAYLFRQTANACPTGWRLPTYTEAQVLINNLQWSATNHNHYLQQGTSRIIFPNAEHNSEYKSYLAIDNGGRYGENDIAFYLYLPHPTNGAWGGSGVPSERNFVISVGAANSAIFLVWVRCVR